MTETIKGKEMKMFLHTMMITTIPGSEERERVPILKILITEEGELVFISKPYPNLKAKK